MGHLEKRRIPLFAERLERLDADNAVDRVVELFPAVQQHLMGTARVEAAEQTPTVGVLILAQGQADDVDVVVLDGAPHRRTPPAADVEQRHARRQIQLGKVQIDLGELRLPSVMSSRSKYAQL